MRAISPPPATLSSRAAAVPSSRAPSALLFTLPLGSAHRCTHGSVSPPFAPPMQLSESGEAWSRRTSPMTSELRRYHAAGGGRLTKEPPGLSCRPPLDPAMLRRSRGGSGDDRHGQASLVLLVAWHALRLTTSKLDSAHARRPDPDPTRRLVEQPAKTVCVVSWCFPPLGSPPIPSSVNHLLGKHSYTTTTWARFGGVGKGPSKSAGGFPPPGLPRETVT